MGVAQMETTTQIMTESRLQLFKPQEISLIDPAGHLTTTSPAEMVRCSSKKWLHKMERCNQ